jgi:hypothetical protein
MAMDLGFLSVITDAIKKTIEAYTSLDQAMSRLDKEKLDAADRAKLQATVKVMKDFSVDGTYEFHTLAITFIPAVSEYLENPDPKKWNAVKNTVVSSMDGLTQLSQTLYKNADIFGSKSFFDPLLESLIQRRDILKRLAAMPEPNVPADFDVLREFLKSEGLGFIS